MEVQVHNSSEPPMKYNQDETLHRNQDRLWFPSPTSKLLKYYAVSDEFYKGNHVKPYLSHQD